MTGISAKSIISLIKNRGGKPLITPNGKQLFALRKSDDGSESLLTLEAGDKNFNEMGWPEITILLMEADVVQK